MVLHRMILHRLRSLLFVGVLLVVLTGCQGGFPADAQGTLDRARGGQLRVGISENPPWTQIDADGGVSGSEVELLTDYAETLEAEIDWVPGGENVLAAQMAAGELDVVIGGLPADAPWTAEIALTRPYTEVKGPDGKTVEIAVGVTPGENALLVDLERFLAERGGEL